MPTDPMAVRRRMADVRRAVETGRTAMGPSAMLPLVERIEELERENAELRAKIDAARHALH